MRSTVILRRKLIHVTVLLAAFVIGGCAVADPTVYPTDQGLAPSAENDLPTTALEVTATSAPVRTLVPQFTPTPRLITPAPSEGEAIDRSMVSPDGEWTALPLYEDLSTGYRISLRVVNKDGSVVWTPVDYTGEGLGVMAPTPRRWSNDSRYFYYLELNVPDGCSDIYPIEESWQMLDIQSGEVTTFDLPVGRGHRFSPDETLMAYVSEDQPLELVILDVTTQTEKRSTLLSADLAAESAQAGQIVWSLDGDELILVVVSGDICALEKPTYYLKVVRLEDLSVRSLYEGDDLVTPLMWADDGKILVKDWNSRSWWMDSTTGKVTTAP